jgi:hypothetical protein
LCAQNRQPNIVYKNGQLQRRPSSGADRHSGSICARKRFGKRAVCDPKGPANSYIQDG